MTEEMSPREIRETFAASFPYDDFMMNWLCDQLFCSVTDVEQELYVLNEEELEELYQDYIVDCERYLDRSE